MVRQVIPSEHIELLKAQLRVLQALLYRISTKPFVRAFEAAPQALRDEVLRYIVQEDLPKVADWQMRNTTVSDLPSKVFSAIPGKTLAEKKAYLENLRETYAATEQEPDGDKDPGCNT